MKIQGCFEKVWEQTKETKNGGTWVEVIGDFQVRGEADVIRVRIPKGKAWCLDHGLQTGAGGEAVIAFGYNDRGYYEQNVWGFKTYAQIAAEKKEREEKKAAAQKTAEIEEKAAEAVKAAEEAGEANLPF